ncbi:uncharacterized protein LOC132048950 [Lycium ferocissimum]|uniref:uncharacterized protein LOC132048950 n=1 Tax=Lycium ferocissimum TaxID=112874 RepID=UPI002814A425|nr:uncharacterized protein LOC132048950 [Lycium ferocissimum]
MGVIRIKIEINGDLSRGKVHSTTTKGNYNNNYGGSNQGNYNNNNNNFGNRSSNPYIPPKRQSNDQGSSRVETMLEKMRDISRRQHPPKKGGLSSDTILNPKNGGGSVDRVFAISTWSGKILQSDKKKIPSEEKVADIPESSKVADENSKQTVKGDLRYLTQLFKSKPPFPQRLVNKKEDAKFEKFYDQLKQLSLNFPFLDVVKEMPGFAKYLKDLLTKKKTVQHEIVSLTHIVSSIISTTIIQYHDFARALCDNGASINFMPLAIYKQSGLGMPRPTTMRLQMADRSIKRPVGMVDDVLVRVGKFMLPTDFVILDCAVDRDIPIIFGRPFLATGRALMDSEKNEIKFRVNDEEVTFHSTKFKMEEESLGEALATILVNFDADDIEDYVETVNSLAGLGSYSYHPKKLNLDLKNRTTPPAKPSIIEPPKLELKQLSSHLKYGFLGPKNMLPVIVLVLLTEEQIERLGEKLCKYRCAIGWTIADIQGIPSGICEHKIQLEKDSKPSVEHQRRLNENMQEVVKNKIIKWLDARVVYPIGDSK